MYNESYLRTCLGERIDVFKFIEYAEDILAPIDVLMQFAEWYDTQEDKHDDDDRIGWYVHFLDFLNVSEDRHERIGRIYDKKYKYKHLTDAQMTPAERVRFKLGFKPVFLDEDALVDEVCRFFERSMVGVMLLIDSQDLERPAFYNTENHEKGFLSIQSNILTVHYEYLEDMQSIMEEAGFKFDKKRCAISL